MSTPPSPSEAVKKQLADLEAASKKKEERIAELTSKLERLRSTSIEERDSTQLSIAEIQGDVDSLHEDLVRIRDFMGLIGEGFFLLSFFFFFFLLPF